MNLEELNMLHRAGDLSKKKMIREERDCVAARASAPKNCPVSSPSTSAGLLRDLYGT